MLARRICRGPSSPEQRRKLSEKAKAQHAARRGFEIPAPLWVAYRREQCKTNGSGRSGHPTPREIAERIGIILPLLLLVFVLPAAAHHAPSGWKYPGDCCGKFDCAPLDPDGVEWTPSGWLIKLTQEVIPFEEARESGDADWHRCRVNSTDLRSPTRRGMADKRRCLYVPAPEN